ncbi:acrosin-like, partial [Protobothrops mucrosquamatus]|uniref:acrosin-like n=1 Tax=Protobothrops mucrosquamatus TaxID=103944 RepID=UPI0010FB055B
MGGINALPGTWPWLVSIQAPSSRGPQHLCAGSLLTPHWVLTAAHCFASGKRLSRPQRIAIGATDISNLLDTVQLRSVSRIVPYQNYNPQSKVNDIALVELSSPVTFDDYVQPACLPHSPMDSEALFSDCYVSGWRTTTQKGRKTSAILQESRVKILETSKCNSSWWYNGAISPHTLCARYEDGGIDTCQGDSGGPLMCKTSPTSPFYVVGITSWGKGCGEGTNPEIYTSTQPFLEWIHGEVVKMEGVLLRGKRPSNKAWAKHATMFPAFKVALTQFPEKYLTEDLIYFPTTELPEVDHVLLGLCGRRPLAPSHSLPIVGGIDTLPGTWPWIVSIRTPFKSGYQHTCGGSLIGAKWILTAAHCFKDT